jgi:hypothetical protein
MPLDTISGAGRIVNREAEVTPASLESFKAPDKPAGTTFCGGRPSSKSPALEGFGHTSTTSSTSKTKGRPWAAEVENPAEDINSSENFRERRGGKASKAIRFLFAFCHSALEG